MLRLQWRGGWGRLSWNASSGDAHVMRHDGRTGRVLGAAGRDGGQDMQRMLVKISTSLFRWRDYDVIDAWRGVQTQEIRDPHGCMRNLPSSAGICAISSRVLFEEFRAMIRCGASDANELEGLPGEAAELQMQGTLCRLDALVKKEDASLPPRTQPMWILWLEQIKVDDIRHSVS